MGSCARLAVVHNAVWPTMLHARCRVECRLDEVHLLLGIQHLRSRLAFDLLAVCQASCHSSVILTIPVSGVEQHGVSRVKDRDLIP